jgi:hypothetical protein
VTRPRPGIRTKILVLVIIIVTILVVWGTGQDPVTAISLALGAGLAGARVARALIASNGNAPTPPDSKSGPPSLYS